MAQVIYLKDKKTGRILEVSEYAYSHHMKSDTISVDRKVQSRFEISSKEAYEEQQAQGKLKADKKAEAVSKNYGAGTAAPAKENGENGGEGEGDGEGDGENDGGAGSGEGAGTAAPEESGEAGASDGHQNSGEEVNNG